ncbi:MULTISPECIES: cytochrome c [unclassified Sulfitobacter]|uniref:c-type cytochrome n=1 Tax=unclassified Sulfitobacter TaxID=196795 RepID=UPI0023E162D8|nr:MULTISPECIES: cytochrome c [unclassified Sulfitobacter]MDF3383393.1 cytochrome c [Sulfitobacter sp. Ks11]MDF3386812.1 cytochrome c [Sulfitobacter sp. M85]MDF3390231.1 cytochrome c [Sulfitobacter sp. Ks16]MDF3400868.1 cytochrome c [Sulfitobacter sp. KE39]MDF3404289.1 cytochrome c [Sulfitobacter sp. Ks35]
MKRAALIFCAAASAAQADHELDGRNLVAGRSLYAENCAACHGADLEGKPDWRTPDEHGVLPAPPHDATGHTWHHGNTLLFDYTKLGGEVVLAARGVKGFNSGMPAFGEVTSDEDIWTILAYIRSTWPPRSKAAQASRNRLH